MLLVTAEEMQLMDKETIETFGIPGQVLMENAGRGAVDILLKTFPDIGKKKVCILAGRGNNGGDGFVIGRYLIQKGIKTDTYLLSLKERVAGDAKANLVLLETLIQKSGFGILKEIPDTHALETFKSVIDQYDVFVDAILGTGLKSEVRGFFKSVIDLVNASGKPVFSVDIPSGLNSETGQPWGICIKAQATATFAFAKRGHILPPGDTYTGILEVVDIGIPGFIVKQVNPLMKLIDTPLIKPLFPPRPSQSHKGTFGHLLVIAGSTGKTGAAALAANAAMACGTGLVTLAVPESLNLAVEPQVTETMTFPVPDHRKGYFTESSLDSLLEISRGKSAVAVGPGIGTHKSTAALIHQLVRKLNLPMVIDADGINCIAQDTKVLALKKAPIILTPHPGEMARLSGLSTQKIQADRTETAAGFSQTHDVILVLKGNKTITAIPDGRLYVCPTGNPGMASGGMGDVLTGITAGFLAQGFIPEHAALAGVYLHGACGDRLAVSRGAFGFTASEMIYELPGAIHKDL